MRSTAVYSGCVLQHSRNGPARGLSQGGYALVLIESVYLMSVRNRARYRS